MESASPGKLVEDKEKVATENIVAVAQEEVGKEFIEEEEEVRRNAESYCKTPKEMKVSPVIDLFDIKNPRL